MGINTLVTEAAHKYNLDNSAATAALENYNTVVMGNITSQITSWGAGGLEVGQPGTITSNYSGGFYVKITLMFTTQTTGVISLVQSYRTGTNELLVQGTGSINFNSATLGTDLQPANMLIGADTIGGNSYANILRGYGGNDRIDGGAGLDTAVFSGFASQYSKTVSGTAVSINGPDGLDTLLSIERLQFDDKSIAFDINGNAGHAYRLYQAAFNRKPDIAGLGWQIKAIDAGATLKQISENFINSAEFKALYGDNPTNNQLVTLLYNNVLHRAPEQAGFDHWMNVLNANQLTRAEVLYYFSESPENQAQVIGSIQNGIDYTYFA